jgi:uncharacterized membrane protein (GlpM family)
VAVLLMKVTLAPGLVAATTLASRRWGAVMGGVIGGFPAVVGPILIALDIQHGDGFAADAAQGALAGLMAQTGFLVAYAWLARRLRWPAAVAGSWAVFAVLTAALDSLKPAPELALPLVLACFAAAYVALPRGTAGEPGAGPPDWDLPVRVAVTAVFVVTLTGVADALGPSLSGLLAAFPVLATVLCAFIHAQEGAAAVADFLRGFLSGLTGFAVFCFTVAELLPSAGPAAAFAAGTAAALAVNGSLAARAFARRRRATA